MRYEPTAALIGALMLCVACTSSARQQSDTAQSRADTTRSDTATKQAAADSPRVDTMRSSPAVVDSSARDSQPWAVDPQGIGRVRIGESLAALSKMLGEPIHASYSYNETCDYVRPRALPTGVKLMVSHDTVVRVDVDSGRVQATSGAKIGTSEARLLTIYRGRVSVQPHPYTGPVGHLLIVPAPHDTMYRLIFETDGKTVTRYRAGRRPEVDFKEGCS